MDVLFGCFRWLCCAVTGDEGVRCVSSQNKSVLLFSSFPTCLSCPHCPSLGTVLCAWLGTSTKPGLCFPQGTSRTRVLVPPGSDRSEGRHWKAVVANRVLVYDIYFSSPLRQFFFTLFGARSSDISKQAAFQSTQEVLLGLSFLSLCSGFSSKIQVSSRVWEVKAGLWCGLHQSVHSCWGQSNDL